MAEPNLAEGIGLQGRVEDNSYQMWAQGQQMAGTRAAARKKASDEDDKAYRDIVGKLKIDGVHNLDLPVAEKNMADWLLSVDETRKNFPNDWQNRIQPATQKAMQTQAQLVVHKPILDNMAKTINENKALGLDTPAETELLEKLTGNYTYDDVAKIAPDPYGTVKYDPTTRSIAHNPLPPINTIAEEDKFLNNDDFKSSVISVKNPNYKSYKGESQYFDSKGIPITEEQGILAAKQLGLPKATSVEQGFMSLSADPNYAKTKEAKLHMKGLLPENYYSLPLEERVPLYKAAGTKDMADRVGYSTSVSMERPYAPTAAQRKPKKDYTTGLGVEKNYNITDSSGKIIDQVTSKGLMSFDPQGASLTLSDDALDASTMKPIKKSGNTANVKSGQILFLPKFIPKKGEREKYQGGVPNKDLDIIKKTNQRDLIEYTPYVEVTSTEKIIVDGKETGDTKSYFVEHNELADNLSNKDAVDVDAAYRHAREKTEKFRSGEKTEKNNPEKKDTAKPSGSTTKKTSKDYGL